MKEIDTCRKLLILLLFVSCNPVNKMQQTRDARLYNRAKTDVFFTRLFKKYPAYFDSLVAKRTDWNIQVIYTKIDRDASNIPKFTDYYYNVNPARYFYPASTVKMPVAALALQRLHELESKGVTKESSMITGTDYSGQTAVSVDSSAPGGRAAIGHYIKKIFLTSDNDAFNRLYEFLGQEYINENLHNKSYTSAQVLHRLDIFLSEDENRHTNPVTFLSADGNILYQQPGAFNQKQYASRNDSLGKAFYKDSVLINTPMNFSKKNRVCLQDLHTILRSLIFPANVDANQRFNLTAEDYRFLHQYMSQFPSETDFPKYDTATFHDAYVKFLMHGNDKSSLPKHIRAFNKVGDAYGQMLDISYIIDFDKNIEFFLSAAIDCNADGIVNDDKYDYETLGFPFMKNLGNVIYQLETTRKRAHVPDLSAFKIFYGK